MQPNCTRCLPACQEPFPSLLGGGFVGKNEMIAIGIIGAVISPVTVVLNLLTLISIYKYRTLHYRPIISLANLSFCSLLTGLVAQPLYSVIFLRNEESLQNCEIVLSSEIIVETFMSCSFFTLCFVGFERFIAIFHPFKQEKILTKTKTTVALLIIWCFSLLNSTMVILSIRIKEILYYVDLVFTLFGAVWMAFVYVRVLLLVRSIKRRVEDSERRFSSNSIRARFKHDGKRTWLTVLVIIIMIAFHVAYDSIILLTKSGQKHRVNSMELQACQHFLAWGWLLYLSLSTITPVVLWLSNSQIRWYMKRMYAYFLCLEGEDIVSQEIRPSRLSKLIAPFLISQRLRMASEMRRQKETLAAVYKTG